MIHQGIFALLKKQVIVLLMLDGSFYFESYDSRNVRIIFFNTNGTIITSIFSSLTDFFFYVADFNASVFTKVMVLPSLNISSISLTSEYTSNLLSYHFLYRESSAFSPRLFPFELLVVLKEKL